MNKNARPKISVFIATSLDGYIAKKMVISLIPVVLGSGIPLFNKINNDKWCRLISSKPFSNGLVQLQYELTTQ